VVIQKRLGHRVVLSLGVADLGDAIFIKLIDRGMGVSHENWGVGGDNELRALSDELMDSQQGGHLSVWGEGSLGFIKDVEAAGIEPVHEQRHKGLPMRLLVKRTWPIGWSDQWCAGIFFIELLDLGGDVEETLSSQEVAVTGSPDTARQAQILVQWRVGTAGPEVQVPATAFSIESPCDCDRLEEGGLSAAVFPYEEGDAGTEAQIFKATDHVKEARMRPSSSPAISGTHAEMILDHTLL
jgi:hypothetical protein